MFLSDTEDTWIIENERDRENLIRSHSLQKQFFNNPSVEMRKLAFHESVETHSFERKTGVKSEMSLQSD